MLRKPLGIWPVGIISLETDYIGLQQYRRRIPMMVFYPGELLEQDKDHESGPTLQGNQLPSMAVYQNGAYLRSLRDGMPKEPNVTTWCYEGLPVSKAKEQYHVIFYNHGLSGNLMESTMLCGDLASMGYVVVSIGHPYGAEIVRFQDGTFFDEWKEVVGDLKETTLSEQISVLFGMLPVRNRGIRNKSWLHFCEKNYATLALLEPMWVEDMLAAYDWLCQHTMSEAMPEMIASKVSFEATASGIELQLAKCMELQEGVGLLGVSFGGCCSISAALKRDVFRYAINLDGSLFVDLKGTRKDVPILVLCESLNPYAYYQLEAIGCSAYSVKKSRGVSHWEYCDGVYFSNKGKKNRKWADTVSKERCMDCITFINDQKR